MSVNPSQFKSTSVTLYWFEEQTKYLTFIRYSGQNLNGVTQIDFFSIYKNEKGSEFLDCLLWSKLEMFMINRFIG